MWPWSQRQYHAQGNIREARLSINFPTIMCVQLADSMIRYPEGVVERLMVKVKNTYILVDFVVLDMEGDL